MLAGRAIVLPFRDDESHVSIVKAIYRDTTTLAWLILLHYKCIADHRTEAYVQSDETVALGRPYSPSVRKGFAISSVPLVGATSMTAVPLQTCTTDMFQLDR